ncbi:MAG: helix-turn-helix domain-containing protein [Lachnospiraceae bacterium]|nr:helix-turn-helix domain-containing protein [Lachnospiraceae bacterium]
MQVIDFNKRQKIEELLKAGTPVIKIAQEIGVHKATLYRELRNSEPNNYSAAEADAYVKSRKQKVFTEARKPVLKEYLKQKKPIALISKSFKCAETTVYNAINSDEELLSLFNEYRTR